MVAAAVLVIFVAYCLGMGLLKQQFFPTSDRREVFVEVQTPEGTGVNVTAGIARRVEDWLRKQPEAKVVTSYIGAGAPRFWLAYNPELPDPSFAKIIVLTDSQEARDSLKLRTRQAVADGVAPEARVRVTQLTFGPYSHFPVVFCVMGPDAAVLRGIAGKVEAVIRANPHARLVNRDWSERVPTARFVLDQDRLQSIGLTSADAAQQLQTLLRGVTVTQARGHPRRRAGRAQRSRRDAGPQPPRRPDADQPRRSDGPAQSDRPCRAPGGRSGAAAARPHPDDQRAGRS